MSAATKPGVSEWYSRTPAWREAANAVRRGDRRTAAARRRLFADRATYDPDQPLGRYGFEGPAPITNGWHLGDLEG